MSPFTSATLIKALRKPRRCYWCPEPLPVGASCVKVAGVWDGMFDVLYVHEDCEEAWQSDPCNRDDEGCPYVHERGKTCADARGEPEVLERFNRADFTLKDGTL